jgi:putative transposase
MIGTTISHYKIVEKPSSGEMGVGYKTHDTRLDLRVLMNSLPIDIFHHEHIQGKQSTDSSALAKRRRKRLRLADYDYSEPGAYFVTICVKDRGRLLGDVSDGVMRLNRSGETVQDCWNDHAKNPSAIGLDAFVVMPNHVHGIIVIVDQPVGSIHESTLPKTAAKRRAMLLPKIIGRFKMNSSKRINELRGTAGAPVWQRNYFEHIIRNDKSLYRIREYIAANPQRWQSDQENVNATGSDEIEMWLTSEGRKPVR